VREQILALVGRHLAGPLRPSGGSNFLTTCPFHKGGQEKTPSFSINVETGLFNCFTCHRGGPIPYLLYLLGLPRQQIDNETAAIKPFLDRNREIHQLEQKHFFVNRDPFLADYTLPESLLGVYDWLPTKLAMDGFEVDTLRRCEVGYDRRGERIMYPLRDMYGNLAGFSGGATRSDQQPKYKVYQGRRKDHTGRRWIPGDFGPWFDEKYADYRCENHDFLWNFDKVLPQLATTSDPSTTVFVVEGFKACMWMVQSGFPLTVALMGSYVSERQQRMLHMLGCRVALFLDNDTPGRRATINVGDLLWRPLYGRIDVVPYPEHDVVASLERKENTQPDDYESSAVSELVKQRMTFVNYFNHMRSTDRWQ
jgi:DNA primase